MFTMQLIAKQISTLENTLELANVKLGRTLLDNRKLIDEIGECRRNRGAHVEVVVVVVVVVVVAIDVVVVDAAMAELGVLIWFGCAFWQLRLTSCSSAPRSSCR